MRRARGLRPHWRESWVERREASGASVTSVKTSPTFPFPNQLSLVLFLGSVMLGDLCKSSNISIETISFLKYNDLDIHYFPNKNFKDDLLLRLDRGILVLIFLVF